MYCPSCGRQVDALEPACPGCGADLVDTLPGPPPDPSIALVAVLHTGDAALTAVARSLLDAHDIEYMVRADGVQDLFGWGRGLIGYNVITGPAEFVVREDDAERARELLRDLVTPAQTRETPGED